MIETEVPAVAQDYERRLLHQALFEGISGLAEQQDNQERGEELPDSPLIELIHKRAKQFRFYESGALHPYHWSNVRGDSADFAEVLFYLNGHQASISKWGPQIEEMSAAGSFDPYLNRYAALSVARKELGKDENPIVRMQGVCTPALIAGLYKPDGLADGQIPKKHKGETLDELIFRKAVTDLKKLAEKRRTRASNKWNEAYSKLKKRDPGETLYDEMMSMPENDLLREGWVDSWIGNSAQRFLDMILSADFTADQFRDQVARLLDIFEQRKDTPEDTVELDTEETGWKILPPEILNKLKNTDADSSDDEIEAELNEELQKGGYRVDAARLIRLGRLALAWDPVGSRLAVSKLEYKGDHEYIAAILPQVIDGQLVEHAIAENPSSENAIYIWRAERGIDQEGAVIKTWRNVLKNRKGPARALGARKVLHTRYYEDNMLEYLTRPVEELSLPGYRR